MGLDPRVAQAFNQQNPFPLEGALVMACQTGSVSQNTRLDRHQQLTPSDVDIKGIIVPPAQYTLGLTPWGRGSWRWQCPADETGPALDVHLFSLAHTAGQLASSNPGVTEWLWLRDEDYLVETPRWAELKAIRHELLSRAMHGTFAGMARSQRLKLEASLNPVRPEAERLGRIEETLKRWGTDLTAARSGPVTPTVQSSLGEGFDAEQRARVGTLLAEYQRLLAVSPTEAQDNRGLKRRTTVTTHQYDTNNAVHMLRVQRMAIEVLRDGVVQVYRTTDADELKAVKRGERTLEWVLARANQGEAEARQALQESSLPEGPDTEALSRVMESMYRQSYGLTAPRIARTR